MIYLTSYCSRKPSIAQAVEELASLGIRNIELTGGTSHEEFSAIQLYDLLEEYDLEFLIHNYFPPQKDDFVLNLASDDRYIRANTLALIRQAVHLSQRFSQNLYSIHAGYAHDLLPQKGDNGLFLPKSSSENSYTVFYQTLELISSQMLPEGFQLAVENAFPAYGDNNFSLLSGPKEILTFLDFCSEHPNVGLLLDLGHLNVASRYLGFDKFAFLKKLVREFSHKIFEIHVSSNDGLRDTHDISTIDSFEIQFIHEHWAFFRQTPIVLEWHQNLSLQTCKEYERIVSYLSN